MRSNFVWYIFAFDYAEERLEIPYYIESKVRDLWAYLTIKEKRFIVSNALERKNASLCFRYLQKTKTLIHIMPNLAVLKNIPQNKHRSKNAMEHTLRVIDVVPEDNRLLRWVALFHDLGKHDSYTKDRSFLRHAEYSVDIASLYCKEIYKLDNSDRILSIVKNHMLPLDYQRNPVWDIKTIIKFVARCGSDYVMDTIDFAYYDKKSENDYEEYLKPILTLKELVKDVL